MPETAEEKEAFDKYMEAAKEVMAIAPCINLDHTFNDRKDFDMYVTTREQNGELQAHVYSENMCVHLSKAAELQNKITFAASYHYPYIHWKLTDLEQLDTDYLLCQYYPPTCFRFFVPVHYRHLYNNAYIYNFKGMLEFLGKVIEHGKERKKVADALKVELEKKQADDKVKEAEEKLREAKEQLEREKEHIAHVEALNKYKETATPEKKQSIEDVLYLCPEYIANLGIFDEPNASCDVINRIMASCCDELNKITYTIGEKTHNQYYTYKVFLGKCNHHYTVRCKLTNGQLVFIMAKVTSNKHRKSVTTPHKKFEILGDLEQEVNKLYMENCERVAAEKRIKQEKKLKAAATMEGKVAGYLQGIASLFGDAKVDVDTDFKDYCKNKSRWHATKCVEVMQQIGILNGIVLGKREYYFGKTLEVQLKFAGTRFCTIFRVEWNNGFTFGLSPMESEKSCYDRHLRFDYVGKEYYKVVDVQSVNQLVSMINEYKSSAMTQEKQIVAQNRAELIAHIMKYK